MIEKTRGLMQLSLMLLTIFSQMTGAASQPQSSFAAPPQPSFAAQPQTLKQRLQERLLKNPPVNGSTSNSLIFDLPLSYNKRVSYWIAQYQTAGKTWFRHWLEKSSRDLPVIQHELHDQGLPQDLAFMVMIESGFEPNAKSAASAVGPWQFIESTGARYGLRISYWLDERRDLKKATHAAIHYMKDLYKEFGSWYLVAASYNMGETNLRRQIAKNNTKDFWALAQIGALPAETTDYVPKILAAMMIAKSPGLYGFDELNSIHPLESEIVHVPGGSSLQALADHLGVTEQCLKDLNAELVLGVIPADVEKHPVRVPRGAVRMVAEYVAQIRRSDVPFRQ